MFIRDQYDFDVYNTNVKSIEGSSCFVRWIDTDWVTENV